MSSEQTVKLLRLLFRDSLKNDPYKSLNRKNIYKGTEINTLNWS
jgi:hypothetical protein